MAGVNTFAFPNDAPSMQQNDEGKMNRWPFSPGMTLRDYFAAKVLPAVYAEAVREMNISGYPDEHWRIGIALDAYAMADAMLGARPKS